MPKYQPFFPEGNYRPKTSGLLQMETEKWKGQNAFTNITPDLKRRFRIKSLSFIYTSAPVRQNKMDKKSHKGHLGGRGLKLSIV